MPNRKAASGKAPGRNLAQLARKRARPYVYLLPTMVLMAVLMVIPMYLVISYTLMDNVISNPNPVFVGLENYKKILSDPVFHEALRNALYFSIMSLIFHLILGLTFAMLLNARSINARLRGFFRVFYILPWVFTATIVALLWRLMLNPSGVVNFLLQNFGLTQSHIEWFGSTGTALHALTFVNIWAGYPFYMVSMLAGLQGIPDDLYEAATIDGAGPVQQFLYVTLPQLKPIIISIAMLDFIWTIQEYALVWMTTGGGPIHATEMMSTYTYKLAFSSYQYSQASTSAVVILAISLFVALFYVRYQTRDD